jgi:hypothetical protein
MLARLLFPSLLLLTFLVATTANAVPVRYDFQSGSAKIDVSLGGSSIASVSTGLVGSFVVYDAAAITIPDFELATKDTIGLPFGSLGLGITATPGAGYASGPGGSSDVKLGPVAIDVDAVLRTIFSIPFNLSLVAAGPVGVDVAINGNTGTFDVSEVLFSFNKFRKDFQISLSAQFVGVAKGPTIPEPSSVLLYLAGLGLALYAVRRVQAQTGVTAS